MQPRIRIKSQLPVGEYTILDQSHTKFYSRDWLLQSFINFICEEQSGEGSGLNREGVY